MSSLSSHLLRNTYVVYILPIVNLFPFLCVFDATETIAQTQEYLWQHFYNSQREREKERETEKEKVNVPKIKSLNNLWFI